MRKVTAYVLERRVESSRPGARRDEAARVLAEIQRWLKWKGVPAESELPEGEFKLIDRTTARARWEVVEATSGAWRFLELDQEIDDRFHFRTAVSVSDEGERVVVYCTLEAGLLDTRVSPVPFDPHCPGFIRDLMGLSGDWFFGPSKVYGLPQRLGGAESGVWLASEIMNRNRSVPIVVVSEDQGEALSPRVEVTIAHELLGLANVYRIDPEASWSLTDEVGSQWSCYSGAIRLYWPGVDYDADPFTHPLWTISRLLGRADSAENAERVLTSYLRRTVMAASALSVERPALIDEIRRAFRHEERTKNLKELSSVEDYAKLAESYAQENERLSNEVAALRDEASRLTVELENLKAIRSVAPSDESLSPEVVAPPATIRDATEKAARLFSKELRFGADVELGVQGLAPDAGPPEKVLRYLENLAEAVRVRRSSGRIGKPLVVWLNDRGIAASGESETIRKSTSEMKKRLWDDGLGRRVEFELHLKPKEATDPANCVRIYFKWSEEDDQDAYVVVGWVGRHP